MGSIDRDLTPEEIRAATEPKPFADFRRFRENVSSMMPVITWEKIMRLIAAAGVSAPAGMAAADTIFCAPGSQVETAPKLIRDKVGTTDGDAVLEPITTADIMEGTPIVWNDFVFQYGFDYEGTTGGHINVYNPYTMKKVAQLPLNGTVGILDSGLLLGGISGGLDLYRLTPTPNDPNNKVSAEQKGKLEFGTWGAASYGGYVFQKRNDADPNSGKRYLRAYSEDDIDNSLPNTTVPTAKNVQVIDGNDIDGSSGFAVDKTKSPATILYMVRTKDGKYGYMEITTTDLGPDGKLTDLDWMTDGAGKFVQLPNGVGTIVVDEAKGDRYFIGSKIIVESQGQTYVLPPDLFPSGIRSVKRLKSGGIVVVGVDSPFPTYITPTNDPAKQNIVPEYPLHMEISLDSPELGQFEYLEGCDSFLGDDTCIGKPCADANPCTDDACDIATGDCTHTNNTLPCDDGNAKTANDTCTDGACVGTPVDLCADAAQKCNDGNTCTTDGCNADTGDCTHVADQTGKPCDDGDANTTDDTCVATTCVGNPIIQPESIVDTAEAQPEEPVAEPIPDNDSPDAYEASPDATDTGAEDTAADEGTTTDTGLDAAADEGTTTDTGVDAAADEGTTTDTGLDVAADEGTSTDTGVDSAADEGTTLPDLPLDLLPESNPDSVTPPDPGREPGEETDQGPASEFLGDSTNPQPESEKPGENGGGCTANTVPHPDGVGTAVSLAAFLTMLGLRRRRGLQTEESREEVRR